MNQFKNIFLNHRNEFYQWALHNLVFGLAGVWMPAVLLRCFGQLKIEEAFTNGSLLMFSVTSCAVSIGFFVKETQVRLRRAYTLTYAGLMITMFVSVLGLTAIITSGAFKATSTPIPLDMPVIYTLSAVAVLAAVSFNFRLFMAEQSAPTATEVGNRFSEGADKLTEQAKQQGQLGSIRL